MAPMFSVIVPVYNVQDYLTQCIDSLLQQTFTDFEIVVVDDVSKDNSLAIAREYAAKHPCIRLVEHTENKGLGGARNTGIEAASGAYLLFLDSDDYLRRDTLALLARSIAQHNADIVEYCFLMVDEKGRSLSRRTYCMDKVPSNLTRSVSACNKAFRAGLFANVRFPEKRYYEDYCTVPKLLSAADTVSSLNEPLYMYRQHAGSIIHDTNIEKNRDILWATDQLLSHFREQELSPETAWGLEYLAIHHVLLSSVLRVNGIDRKSSLQKALKDYVQTNFPSHKKNPYRKLLSPKDRRLLALIEGEKWELLYLCYHTRNRITGWIKRKLKGK